MALLGEDGFRKLAALNHDRAVQAADKLARIKGVELMTPTFFNEFTLKLAKPAAPIVDQLAKEQIIAGVPVSRLKPHDKSAANLLLVAVTETTTPADIDALALADLERILAVAGGQNVEILGGQTGLEQLHVRNDVVNDKNSSRHISQLLNTRGCLRRAGRRRTVELSREIHSLRWAWICRPRIPPSESAPHRPSWRKP